jgi:putative DNA primase/helicase
MALRGRRLAWASETDEGRRFNSGKVKWYVGGDSLTGRDPYGRRQVTFAPTHMLILLTNRRPHAPADDFAFWARIHLLEFGLQFVDNPVGPKQRKRDPGLGDKLRGEASGVLAWLVRGCLEWQEQGGLNPPASVRAATESYREAEDVIGAFLADSCEEGPTLTARAAALYRSYREWCQENGHKAASSSRFKERISARFPWTRDRGGAFYSGLGLQQVLRCDGGDGYSHKLS